MLLLVAFYGVTPGPAMIRTRIASAIGNYYHGYHIFPHTFFFGNAVAFLRESYTLMSREIPMFLILKLSDPAYVS